MEKSPTHPELTPDLHDARLADRSSSNPIGDAEDVLLTVGKFQFPAELWVLDLSLDPREPLILRRISKDHRALIDLIRLFLAIEDDPTSPEVDPTYYDPDGDILLLEAILNINEPPEVELKDLPPHLEYAFLEGDGKLPVIIAKDLKNEEKTALIEVLKSHKRSIAWKLSDIKGINPEFCTHKILMEGR
ncbi:hypothetical protein Tco_0038883 [Tanacetum coccineum]